MALPAALVRLSVQEIVRGHIVEPTEGDQMPDGQLVGPTLVACIHGLGGSQDLGHLGLGQIVVLPESPDLLLDGFHVVHLGWKSYPPKCSKRQNFTKNIVKNFTGKAHFSDKIRQLENRPGKGRLLVYAKAR